MIFFSTTGSVNRIELPDISIVESLSRILSGSALVTVPKQYSIGFVDLTAFTAIDCIVVSRFDLLIAACPSRMFVSPNPSYERNPQTDVQRHPESPFDVLKRHHPTMENG